MSNRYKRIAVKIGSNVLTRADGTLDITRMSAIVDQVADLHHRGVGVIIISSGAVASGRSLLSENKKLDAVSARQLYSAVGQAKLINRYYELFREHGIACGQVLTTKENFSTRRHYLNQKHCMEVMLANDVIPIVNENDTVSVTELMFTDNDELSGLIASMMDMQALVILSNIDGVYDGNPADPASKVITDMYHETDASEFIQEGKSTFGRGGMATKYRIARKVASEGIAVIIANGKRDNILQSVIATERTVPYTLFHPASEAASGVQKWIAHSEGWAKGEIHINEGAAKALLGTQRASLLPVGVTRIDGDFEKDDIVKIIAPQGNLIALGKTSYDSADARAVIGESGARPIVHSDYLYID
ncbi:MAG: glutamate 5-kinase [Muribaculaceae bacterium]|jgi:glutamate 5-kinase|nr:glutamate 5-kinase [Muribaculaceae bacterium]MEE0975718.1 glutamate 5-kinase [Muribaculaceae bacterium]